MEVYDCVTNHKGNNYLQHITAMQDSIATSFTFTCGGGEMALFPNIQVGGGKNP